MSGQANISTAFMESLTLGEIEEVEELGGAPLGAFVSGGGVPAKAMRALVFVIRRRAEPKLTFDECRSMTIADFVEVIESVETPEQKPLGKLRAKPRGVAA